MKTQTEHACTRALPGSRRAVFLSAAVIVLISALFAVQFTTDGDAASASDLPLIGAPLSLSALPNTDTDGDGFNDDIETSLGSLPEDGASTPEHAALPLTCGDGLDNDGDGDTDFDGGDTGCTADSDADGSPDMVEVELQSKPFLGGIGDLSSPEDLTVAGTCSDGADNDGDGDTDDADAGCLDDDGDGFSDERELAHGSDHLSAASTPENLLSIPSSNYYPSGTHRCLDTADNDGDDLTDGADTSCRVNLRLDMNTTTDPMALGVQDCRSISTLGSPPAPATVIEAIIENPPPMAGLDLTILYPIANIDRVSAQASVTTGVAPGSNPNFWAKILEGSPFNGSEPAETSPGDGVYTTFFTTIPLVGDYGKGNLKMSDPLGGIDDRAGGTARISLAPKAATEGTISVITIDPTDLIIRDQANGTVVEDLANNSALPGGIIAHNPLSIFNGMFEFQDSPPADGACSAEALKDTDDDGIPDTLDNAPEVPNPNQADSDFDDVGDVVDTDTAGPAAGTPTPTAPATPGASPTSGPAGGPDTGVGPAAGSDGSSPWLWVGLVFAGAVVLMATAVGVRRLRR